MKILATSKGVRMIFFLMGGQWGKLGYTFFMFSSLHIIIQLLKQHINDWMNEWVNEWMNDWMNEWVNE